MINDEIVFPETIFTASQAQNWDFRALSPGKKQYVPISQGANSKLITSFQPSRLKFPLSYFLCKMRMAIHQKDGWSFVEVGGHLPPN